MKDRLYKSLVDGMELTYKSIEIVDKKIATDRLGQVFLNHFLEESFKGEYHRENEVGR